MLSLMIAIAGMIGAGYLVAITVLLTFAWLTSKIRQRFADKKAKKVAVAELDRLIQSCSNIVSLEQVEQLNEVSNEGYTHLMATVDDTGKVYDVEVIKDTSDTLDEEVSRFINNTDEGMVVIT